MNISKGQRLALTAFLGQADSFGIGLFVSGSPHPIDFACFGLDAAGKLTNDAYMTFFNQPKTPCGAVELSTAQNDNLGFLCQLNKLPNTIERLVFTAAIDGNSTMRQINNGYLRFLVANQEVARFAFSSADFQDEKALMLGELYRKDGLWRFSAIGQGFNGGLADLVKHFGADVADDKPAAPVPKVSLEKKLASAPKLVNLAKKASVSLEKNQLTETIARVGLVLDASGSMMNQYKTGKVQEVIERLLPLAVHFDDDGALDVWAFSDKTLELPAATLSNYAEFINSIQGGWRNWNMMHANDEPRVIKQVIQRYKNTSLPVLVIFISDGGVSRNKDIQALLTDAAKLPIFWQFVGIGGRNYGVLEKLDTLQGRVVDNCGFFALDDLHSVNEQELYDRLLSEFPLWLKAAKSQGII